MAGQVTDTYAGRKCKDGNHRFDKEGKCKKCKKIIKIIINKDYDSGHEDCSDNDWTISVNDMYSNVTGNVGIGTTTPRGKLTVGNSTTSNGTPVILIADPQTRIELEETDASANNKRWDILADQESLVGRVIDDADTIASQWMRAHRTGVTVDSVTFLNGSVGIGTEFPSPSTKPEVIGNITATGSITQGSSKELKKDITYLSTKEAIQTLQGLNPIKYKYKADNLGEEHLGFIAEDVPDLVAFKNRKQLSSMDMTAILVKVVQEQQRMLKEQQETIEAMKHEIQLAKLW